ALPARDDRRPRLHGRALRLGLPARLVLRNRRVRDREGARRPPCGRARSRAGARRLMWIEPLHLVDVVVQGETWPVFAWAIRAPGGTILVDTGMIDSTPELDAEWG